MTDLGDLYAGARAILWVESPAVRDLLVRTFEDDVIRVISAGTTALVPMLVDASGNDRVFGAVGRGFGSDNRHRWQRPPPTLRTYIAPVFDLEAWRVGPEITPPPETLCRWMAGRHLLADTARAARAGLPEETDLDAILASGWFSTVATDLPSLADPDWVRDEWTRLEAEYRASCRSQAWRARFPGKALLGEQDGQGGTWTEEIATLKASILGRTPA